MRLTFLLIFSFIVCSCNSVYIPKPKAYPRIDLPVKEYQQFNQKNFPFTFEYPKYASISKDSSYFEKTLDNQFWINVDFPSIGGRIYLTYKFVNNDINLLVKDAYQLTSKQQYKASIIQDSSFINPQGYDGVFFYVGGEVATKYQFFVTDSKKHFLRGALYFNTSPNEDSLALVNDFVKEDMLKLINTLKFR